MVKNFGEGEKIDESVVGNQEASSLQPSNMIHSVLCIRGQGEANMPQPPASLSEPSAPTERQESTATAAASKLMLSPPNIPSKRKLYSTPPQPDSLKGGRRPHHKHLPSTTSYREFLLRGPARTPRATMKKHWSYRHRRGVDGYKNWFWTYCRQVS